MRMLLLFALFNVVIGATNAVIAIMDRCVAVNAAVAPFNFCVAAFCLHTYFICRPKEPRHEGE